MYLTSKFNDTILDIFDVFNKVNFYGDNIINYDQPTKLEVPLPGFAKKDLNISVEGRTLIISADVKEDKETQHFKSFRKTYILPVNVDIDVIDAKMSNGLLVIDFGESSDIKEIKIK